MGRKKIRIEPIKGDRNRSATYLKRKHGLFKKAHELAVLTDSQIAVIVIGNNGKVAEFCSGNMDDFLMRYTEYDGTIERRRPEHFSKDSFENDMPLDESPTGMSASPKQDSLRDIMQSTAPPRLSNHAQFQDSRNAADSRSQSAGFESTQLHTASGMQDSVAQSVPESIPPDLAQVKHTALRMAHNWDESQIHQIRSNALVPTPLDMEAENDIRRTQVAGPHKLPNLTLPPPSSDLRRSASASFPIQGSFHTERSMHLHPTPVPTRHTLAPDHGLEHKHSSNGPNSFMQTSTGYALPTEINYLHAATPSSNPPTPNLLALRRPPNLLIPPQQLSSSQHGIDAQGSSTSPLTPHSAQSYSPGGHSTGLDVSPLSISAVSDSPLSPLPPNIQSYLATPDPSITAPPSTDMQTQRGASQHQPNIHHQGTPYSIILTPNTPILAMTRDASEIHVQQP